MQKLCLFILSFVAISCGGVSAAEAPASYYVPPAQFNAALQVMDMGFSNMFALFQNATGSFTFDEASKSIARLRVALDAGSLITNNPESQRALTNQLGAMRYPEIDITAPDSTVFTDNKAQLKGTLTLHGVSKPVVLEATLNRFGKSSRAGGMWSSEGDAIGLSLRTEIKRADFGLGDDPATSARFGDPITLMIEMQGAKQ